VHTPQIIAMDEGAKAIHTGERVRRNFIRQNIGERDGLRLINGYLQLFPVVNYQPSIF
jgi:hypothetical protein